MDMFVNEGDLIIDKPDRLAMIFRASFHLSHDAFPCVTGAYHEHIFSLPIDHLFAEDPGRQSHSSKESDQQQAVNDKNRARITRDLHTPIDPAIEYQRAG